MARRKKFRKTGGFNYFGKKVELQEVRFDKDTFFEKNKSIASITGGALTTTSFDVNGKAITEFQGRKINSLPDQDLGINAESMVNSGVLIMTPTADRTVSLPTLAQWSEYVNQNLSAFDFTIINLSTTNKITFTNSDSSITVRGSLVLNAESSVTYRIVVIDADGSPNPEEGILVNLTQTNVPAVSTVVKENNPNVGSWARNGRNIDTSSDDNNPEGIYFKPDGTQLYILGRAGRDVEQYALSTAWNISTASRTGEFSNINTHGTSLNSPRDIYISPDGVYLFIVDDQTNNAARFTMGTAWDITSCDGSSLQVASVANADGNPMGIHLSNDGTKLFVVGHANDRIDRFVLSSAFDLSTMNTTVDQTKALNDIPLLIDVEDGTATMTNPSSIRFNDDGTRMVVLASTHHQVFEYTLSTGYDLSTATYTAKGPMTRNFDTAPTGIYFNETAKKAYFVGSQQDKTLEYDTHGPYVETDGAFWFKNGFTSERDAIINGGLRVREMWVEGDVKFQSSLRMSHNVYITDNKGLYIGTGNDLYIYHDGTDTYMHNDEGDLCIENSYADGDIKFKGDDGTGSAITEYFRVDGGDKAVIFSQAVKLPTLNISNIPTSSAGLSSGDVYNDSGTLKIV